MRILIASSNTSRNGAVVYARRILALLAARGHTVWLAADPESWIARETAGQVPLLETRFRRWPLDELSGVAAFCRQERVDLFHSHNTRAASFGCLLRLLHGIPSVAHLHADRLQTHAWLQTLSIAVSNATLRSHRRRLGALGDRGTVLMNFVDTGIYRPAQGPDRLRADLGVSADTPVLLVVGEICRRKGQDLAARAVQLVRRAHPRAVLALAGPGSLPAGTPLDGVHLLGVRNDIPEILPHATLLLIPSRNEPCPLAAFEAMACRVPVIAANAGGVAEIVADGGGRLVPRGDIPALAAEAISLLDDPRERDRQAAAGLSRVEEKFAPGPHIEALERLFATALARP